MSATEDQAEIFRLRSLLADIHTALLASGWRDDQLIKRVKNAAAVSRMIERPKVTEIETS